MRVAASAPIGANVGERPVPTFAMFRRRLARCTVRADIKPSLAALVRPLSRPFPPFGQGALPAQLSRSRPRPATSAIRRLRTFHRQRP